MTSDETYLAYGKQRDSGKVVTDNRFTGQKEDGNGLMYYGARYYDPQIGLFVSPDTIVPDAGVVAQYNRYSYVLGRVMNANDPTGHTCVDRDSGQPGGNCGGGGGGVGTGYVDKGGRSPYGANSGGVSSVGKGNWFTRGVNRFWNWITGRGQHESIPQGSVTNSSTIQASKAIGGLDDLAQRRQNLNIPAAGTKEGERFTVARLDVNGRKFYGQNGDSTKHPGLQDANPRSLGHAERDAFGQAVEAFPNGVKGGEATLYVDREPCIGGCRSNIGTWADQLGVDKVTVISRNNYLGEWTRNTGRYRTIQWMKPE